jgi:hypothetical protein
MTDLPHPEELTREETAWLMKAIWAALQSPKWGFFNSKDLETLGKAIASGKALKDLDSNLLDKIWPHMLTVTQHLGLALKTQAAAADSSVTVAPKTTIETSEPPVAQPVATQE